MRRFLALSLSWLVLIPGNTQLQPARWLPKRFDWRALQHRANKKPKPFRPRRENLRAAPRSSRMQARGSRASTRLSNKR